MNYEKFLNKTEHLVLGYLGGPHVYGENRKLRLCEGARPALGFHRFEIKGRNARALEAVDCPDLEALPRARGHVVRGWLCSSRVERLMLGQPGGEELAPLALVRARRWHSGDLVFESTDFEGEVESEARLRLERFGSLADLKGVPASLRVAYGIALAFAVAGRVNVSLSALEIVGAAPSIAQGGEPVATSFLTDVVQRRNAARPAPPPFRASAPTLDNGGIRAEIALDEAGARMLSSRNVGQGNLEVAFEFMGERFISVVDALTLHVYDSGVCLAGADELVTLESLPAVIREAIETNALVITRR